MSLRSRQSMNPANPMNRFLLRVVVCLISGLLFSLAVSAQGRPGDQEEVSPAVRQAVSVAAAKYKIPGIAVAIIDRGHLAGIEVFGVRDKRSNAQVTANTIFEAGALGEPVYTYAVLTLAADGRFDPGAPLTKYLPLPYVRGLDPISGSDAKESLFDPQFNQITALRVMNHTSGMPDWARNTHLNLQTSPGQKWSYSNEGYIYLQQVMDHVTNESFEAFTLRSVFGPARMGHSSFTWNENSATQMAAGYDRAGEAVNVPRYMAPAAGTTLYTTIEDYARFVMFMLASAPAQRAHESAISLMLSPTVTADNSFSWGLGCGIEKDGDDLFFFNRGLNPGFQSFAMASRKTGKGIVILTNSENGLDAVPEIVIAAIGGSHPIFKSAFLHPKF